MLEGMRVLLVVATCALPACSDSASPPDIDAPPAGPGVMVRSPNGGETYYPTATVSVQWTATGTGALTAVVEAVNGASSTSIASGVAATSGEMTTTSWTLAGLPDATTYRIRVTVTDGDGATAEDTSNADFTIRTAQAVSFAGEVQPIFTASCTGSSCHDNSQPAAGLVLTSGSAYAELVGMASMQCPANSLVDAGKPELSYLQFKLDGSGPCFAGSAMPLGSTLVPAQILKVRDWIATGAPNN